jgi:hypothetical protein
MDLIYPHLLELASSGRDVIVCGDWNIAHQEIDLKNWRGNRKNSGFLPEERAWVSRLLNEGGWCDVYRRLHPDAPKTPTPGGQIVARPGQRTSAGGSTTSSSRQRFTITPSPSTTARRARASTRNSASAIHATTDHRLRTLIRDSPLLWWWSIDEIHCPDNWYPRRSLAPLSFARDAIVVSVHLRARTVLQEVCSFSAGGHLRTVRTAVTLE